MTEKVTVAQVLEAGQRLLNVSAARILLGLLAALAFAVCAIDFIQRHLLDMPGIVKG